jgi:hypothetical protein
MTDQASMNWAIRVSNSTMAGNIAVSLSGGDDPANAPTPGTVMTCATTKVVENQGRGASTMRTETVRRILPRCWFNQATTEAGRDALGYYHERKDETRNIGLGPEHDWSSHAADAFGLMAICYEEPAVKVQRRERPQIASAWSA